MKLELIFVSTRQMIGKIGGPRDFYNDNVLIKEA